MKTSKTFKAKLEQLYPMMAFLKEYAVKMNCSKEFQFELAFEEVLINIIEHGYPNSCGDIQIIVDDRDPTLFHVEIHDQGIPHNPLKTLEENPLADPLTQTKVGGYGIYIIVQTIQTVSYRYSNNCNILTLSHPIRHS